MHGRTQSLPPSSPPPYWEEEEDEIDLLDLLLVLARRKGMIVKATVGAAVLSLIISLLLPKYYTAKTSILPPQQGSSTAAAMLGQLGAVAGLAGAAAGIKNPADQYVGMLKSRFVEDDLIRQFHLQSLYDQKTLENTRKQLESDSSIAAGKDGFITIEFSAKDPKLSAAVANAYVDGLNRVMTTLAVTDASQKRLFFEKQLDQERRTLAQEEFELQKIQKGAGLIQDYPLETEIATANARLRGEIAAKEVQLSAMQIRVTPNNPDYQRLQEEIRALKTKLQGDESRETAPDGLPKDSLDYFQKFRDVKFHQAVMEVLFKQYELAKVDEAKDFPLIQVLDKATPPELKSKPKKGLIVVLSTLAAFFLSVLWAFIAHALDQAAQDPERAGKLQDLRRLWTKR